MKCPQCQKEIPDTALYCPFCGIKLSDQAENSENILEEETESLGYEKNAFSDSDFAPSPFGDSSNSYEDSYTSYTSYGTGDGWDPYSQILPKEESSEYGVPEKEQDENETLREESVENGNSEMESEDEIPEKGNINEKKSEESSDSEQKDLEKLKPVEVLGISTSSSMEDPAEYKGNATSSHKRKRKFPLLFLLVMAAVVYIGYQKGFSGGKKGSNPVMVASDQKTENTNAGEEIDSQEISGEIQAEPSEEGSDMSQEDVEEEIIVMNTPTPEITQTENTEGLFPVSIEQELNMDESASDTTGSDEPQERTASLVEYQEGTMDSAKRIEIVSAEATSTIVQEKTTNEPMLMFDNKRDTNWQEGVDGSGIGQSFTATFRDVSKVKYITFLLGNWKTDKYYYGNNRPKKLTLELDDFKTQIEFPDVWEEFCVEISPACDASSLRVTLDEVYAGSSWDDTVITDINLYSE